MSITAKRGTIIYKGVLRASYYRSGKRSRSDSGESLQTLARGSLMSPRLQVVLRWRGHKTCLCSLCLPLEYVCSSDPRPRKAGTDWKRSRERQQEWPRPGMASTLVKNRLYPFSLEQISEPLLRVYKCKNGMGIGITMIIHYHLQSENGQLVNRTVWEQI